MDKINYINPFSNPESNKKLSKNKKEKLKSESSFLNSSSVSSFDEVLNDSYAEESEALNGKDKDLPQKRIETLLKEIGKQGERLKKSRNLEDLDIYKKMIKEYISLILKESENIEKRNVWNPSKKQKINKVHLQVINSELLELTRIFFSDQQNNLAIAAKIDKIEGLLIDLKS